MAGVYACLRPGQGSAIVDPLRWIVETWNAIRLGLAPELSAFPANGILLSGCLFGDDGRWLTLPAIRESIRGWRPYPAIDDEAPAALSTADGAWIEFLARNLLGRPELYGATLSAQTCELLEGWTHQTVFDPRTSAQDAAVLAPLAEVAGPRGPRPVTVPSASYPYLDAAPMASREYAEHLEKQSDPDSPAPPSGLGPIADRATQLLFDDAQREAFLAAYDRHGVLYSGIVPADADAAFRSRVLATFPGDTPARNRAAAAEVVYRALRLAVYWRMEEYLRVRFPGWRDLLAVDVPLGTEHKFASVHAAGSHSAPRLPSLPELLASLPVPCRWVAAWPHWVEQFDHRIAVDPVYADRPRGLNLVGEMAADQRADREFAALAELAYDDVNPGFGGTGRWPDAERMFYRALQTLLLLDKHAAAVNKPANPTRLVRRPEAPTEKENRENGALERGGGKAVANPAVSVAASLLELDEYLARTSSEYDVARLRLDPELLHHWASRLRSDFSERRAPRTQQLAERIGRTVRGGALGDGDLVDLIDGAQLLAFDMTNHSAHRTGELFLPVLGAARHADAPLAANIWRAIAIQHSKVHEYGHAQAMLHEAAAVLDRLAARPPRPGDDRTEINLLEASQQVYLQSTGLHARIVEMLLSDPAKRRLAAQSQSETEYVHLRTMAGHALKAGGHAYHLLKQVKLHFDLPQVQQQHRAATRNWEINTRAMHMRTLLLMGTLHAAEGEPGLQRRDRAEAERRMRSLVDAVPEVFHEATSFPAAANFGPELTRIAMHYALLSGMRLVPCGSGAVLPRHLTTPAVLRKEHDPGYPVLDLDGATAYLISQRNDAGILGNIQYEPARLALVRYSRPPDGRLPMGYERWLRHAQPELRRPFDPNQFMPGHELLKPPRIIRIER